MPKLFKIISIIITISILFSSCGSNSAQKVKTQIEEYFKENQYNECLKYVSELESDVKNENNALVLSLISAEYNELVNAYKVNTDNCYALNTIDNNFAENCRKLWNIAKVFNITSNNENYNDFVYLHYYAEMCNYTKYGEIYALLKNVHKTGYLNEITNAISSYDNDGDSSSFDKAYKASLKFSCDSYNPQEYLVEDYKNAHNNIIKALKSLCNGFATSDINVIASSMSDLEDALTSALHITDTINAIHAKQIYIFNELSDGNINTTFNTDFEISERDYLVGITFSLDNVFGENIVDENSDNSTGENSVDSEKISKNEALKIAVKAINKTKAYKSKLNIEYTQTKNIQMTSYDNGSSVTDAVELTKTAINNTLNDTNGTNKSNIVFNKGMSGDISLNTLIPPSNKNAVVNSDSIKDFTIVNGSGGYVITLTFYPEATTESSKTSGIGSIINGFSFESNKNMASYKSTYSTATAMITVNNNGLLEKMEYKISGNSDCDFVDDNNNFLFEAQFTFIESYSYSFKY